MSGPSVEETEALFSERLGDLGPTLEEIDRMDWVKVALTIRPNLGARLLKARAEAAGRGAADVDRGKAMAFLLQHLLDPILTEVAHELKARYDADAGKAEPNGG